MKVIDNKALLLTLRNPQRVTSIIPKSKHVGNGQVLVHWGLDEAQVLKNLQVRDVPSPILGHYDWPGMYKPFDHQRTTASFLTLHKKAFCFNEQGTGKTGSVIWAADYLMKQGRVRRVLVICPLSIMDSAWRADLFRFAMHRTVDIAYGSREKRQAIIRGKAEFVIINYDGVEIVAEEIARGGFDLIVADECFVAGTVVATPSGYRPIEQLTEGEEVLTSSGVSRIKRLVRNTSTQLVEVNLGNGKRIRCTPDHPFFTDAGWVCAKNLTGRWLFSESYLSDMRKRLQRKNSVSSVASGAEQKLWHNLHEILCSEEMASYASGGELSEKYTSGTTGTPHRTKNAGTSKEVIGFSQSQRTQATDTWGERNGDYFCGTIDSRGITCGVDMELPGSVGEEAARLSYKLQSRLRESSGKNSIRSRWEQSYTSCTESAGSQERTQTTRTRVESVSYIECPDGETVYNLEVEGTPNYFVGDSAWLVHNCNHYKNAQTKRWRALNSLVKPDTWLWMLTGTPAAQSPVDAYGLAKLVNPMGVPRFFTAFKDMVMVKVSNFRWIPKETATKDVFQALQPAIRYTKDECLDLPEMTYVKRRVELTKQQERYYMMLKKSMVMEAAGEEITAVNAAVNMNKLLQISCGAVYSDSGETLEFDIKNRYNVLKEVIEETNQKVLVFAPFKHIISLLADKLIKDGLPTEVISGDVSASKRAEIFRAFQETHFPRVLVIQPQAAAHGVTLTAADTVVWWGPTSSLETYAQANARVHRPGQRHPTTVVQLQGSGVERHMYNLLDNKIDVHSKIVQLYSELLA